MRFNGWDDGRIVRKLDLDSTSDRDLMLDSKTDSDFDILLSNIKLVLRANNTDGEVSHRAS